MKKREWENEEYNEGDSSLSPRRVTSIFWEMATPGSFPIQRQHPLWGDAIEESAKVSLSFGKMMPRLPQQLTDEIKTKSALEPSFPHTSPPFLMPLIVFWCRQRQFIFTKLLNHRFPEAHYNVFHGCIISTQKEPKSFDGLEILYFFYEI